MEQQLLIDPNDRQTAAYNAIKYDKISMNERTILTATSTCHEALQVISNLKSAFHAYHHQEIIHTSYVPILVDRLQLHYRYDKAKRDECDHWRDWSKAVFTQHLEIIWPQTEDVADRTFLEAVRDLPFQYDLENIEVEQKTLTAISNIHSHYTDRTEGDDVKAVKIMLEKLNDAEHIN